MQFLKRLPRRVRPTFYHDLKAAMYFGVFGGLLYPFFPIIGRKIGATNIEIALLMAAPYITSLMTFLLTEDIFGKGRMCYVVWFNIIGRGLILLMFFIYSPFYYTLIILLFFFISAFAIPSFTYIMKSNYPDEQRGRLMGYVRIGMAVLWIIASWIGGFILNNQTGYYRYVFPVAAVFGMLSVWEFGKIRVRKEVKTRSQSIAVLEAVKIPFKDRAFLIFLISYTIFEMGFLMAMPLYPIVMVDYLHITNLQTGALGSVFSLSWLIGFFFWGMYMDRYSRQRVMITFYGIAAILPFLYFLKFSFGTITIAFAIAGFTIAAIEMISFNLITHMGPQRLVPKYSAIHITLSGVRGSIFPFVGIGLINIVGIKMVFLISTLLILTAIAAPALHLFHTSSSSHKA
jgi:MFS family permease